MKTVKNIDIKDVKDFASTCDERVSITLVDGSTIFVTGGVLVDARAGIFIVRESGK